VWPDDSAAVAEMFRAYGEAMTLSDISDAPDTDDRDPADLIPTVVEEVLRLAETWLCWDGTPRFSDGNAWTPHKAMRRVTDHLLDHLTEIDSLLAGAPPVPDTWHGRKVTLDADWSRFTEADLDEAGSRLLRYAQLFRLRLTHLSPEELDLPRPGAWTIRQIAHHVSNVAWYARQVGDLTAQDSRHRG
jgi:hypothetical protein